MNEKRGMGEDSEGERGRREGGISIAVTERVCRLGISLRKKRKNRVGG